MRTTPLPLVAALAGCVGGTGTTKTEGTPPMPYYADTSTVIAPMIPPDSGTTTVISPMPPPPMPYYQETADTGTGTTSGGTGLPVAAPAPPMRGLSPLPEREPR